jgi:hypothetical protein
MDSQVLHEVSTDRLERFLTESEGAIGGIRANQMTVLAELDRRQVATGDGCRSLNEWVASRLDVAPETAATLVGTGRRLVDRPRVAAALESGDVTFDRAVAVVRGDDDDVLWHLDIAAVRRRVAQRKMLAVGVERDRFADQYVAIQPVLSGDGGRFHGELAGIGFHTFEKALQQRGDTMAPLPDGRRLSRNRRNAHALVAIAQDSLDRCNGDRQDAGAGPRVAVLVDATNPSGGGAAVEYGPTVGPDALEAVLCHGSVQVIGIADGRPVTVSDSTRAIPPAVRRYVAARDGGCCADGCTSRYRLQPHHVVPRSRGGTHHPTNLRTLCWFHHHVVIHGYGYTIDPATPTARTRFLQPGGRRAPPARR